MTDAAAEATDFVHAGPGFVHAGPGTLAGRYLRRFWHPVHLSRELKPGQAVPIRVMGEDFTLFRGEGGTAQVLAHRCAHRGAQLSVGRVDGDALRCRFHGWTYDAGGRCIEQPAEPAPFCAKIRIAAHPTVEQLGLVFAYFGPAPTPPIPRWPELDRPNRMTTIETMPCNWFQFAENIVDDVHVGFVHRDVPRIGTAQQRRARIPRVSAEETAFGLTQHLHHDDGKVERNHFLMPNVAFLAVTDMNKAGTPVLDLFWYVPIDDVSFRHVLVSVVETDAPLTSVWPPPSTEPLPPIRDEIAAVLAGRTRYEDVRHPEIVRIQDAITVVGQGAIADRRAEHLGATDAAVILLRKIWSRELRRVAAGEPPTPFVRPADLRAISELPPRSR
jgi:5,5'-dehydrodivanillate O-demethylase oxygenase subunit